MKIYQKITCKDKSVLCPLCRDGWPRHVDTKTLKCFHELPEPVGSAQCFENFTGSEEENE